MTTISNIERDKIPLPQRALLEVLEQIRDRTTAGEDTFSGAAVNLLADSATVSKVSTALAPGKYLAKYIAAAATDLAFLRQLASTGVIGDVTALNGYPLQHGEERIIRVTGSADSVIGVHFLTDTSYVRLIKVLERGEG